MQKCFVGRHVELMVLLAQYLAWAFFRLLSSAGSLQGLISDLTSWEPELNFHSSTEGFLVAANAVLVLDAVWCRHVERIRQL